jgi:Fe-S oxidoreductase
VLDLEDESAWEDESLGINHIHQLNWKQGLDLYTCTECGRCKEVCPTYTTDKPLNLHDFNDQLKFELYAKHGQTSSNARTGRRLLKPAMTLNMRKNQKQMAELNSEKQLMGDVIAEDTLWACTTCRACEAVCP